MSDFDLRKYLAESRLLKEDLKNPEAAKAMGAVITAIDNFRKIANTAYGGEKQDIYSSAAGDEFKALDKAISDLGNKIRLKVEDHSIKEDTMEEGDVTESVLAGIAALVGGTVGLGKLLDYLKSKGFELTDPNGKSVLDTTIRGLKKEGEAHEGEEMEEEVNEEEIKENTFKASIKDILNS